jgi:hypothetical protein
MRVQKVLAVGEAVSTLASYCFAVRSSDDRHRAPVVAKFVVERTESLSIFIK